jgi:hypothetical protein
MPPGLLTRDDNVLLRIERRSIADRPGIREIQLVTG